MKNGYMAKFSLLDFINLNPPKTYVKNVLVLQKQIRLQQKTDLF